MKRGPSARRSVTFALTIVVSVLAACAESGATPLSRGSYQEFRTWLHDDKAVAFPPRNARPGWMKSLDAPGKYAEWAQDRRRRPLLEDFLAKRERLDRAWVGRLLDYPFSHYLRWFVFWAVSSTVTHGGMFLIVGVVFGGPTWLVWRAWYRRTARKAALVAVPAPAPRKDPSRDREIEGDGRLVFAIWLLGGLTLGLVVVFVFSVLFASIFGMGTGIRSFLLFAMIVSAVCGAAALARKRW